MRRKIKKSIKLFFGFLTLWSLFSVSSIFHKTNNIVVDQTKYTNKKEDSTNISPNQQGTDDNSYLFVDCTGFFE